MQNRAARDGQGRYPREIASRASALWMSSLRALRDATLLKEIGGDAMMHPPTGGRAAPSASVKAARVKAQCECPCCEHVHRSFLRKRTH